ncbi:MAG TPA: hypothetical protein VLR26_08620 [Frankiaceae bacterium]|nr:hypothetical protein [Frankiaceae bacterium]
MPRRLPLTGRPIVAAIALFSILGLAACGSSDLPKDKYIAKVDPICAKYQQESKKIPEPQNVSDRPALASYYNQIADLADKQTKEIDGVGRPKDGKAQIDSLLSRQRSQIDKIRQLATAIQNNDEAKANQIGTDAEPVDKQITTDLKAFGFKTCGSEG